MQEKKHFLIMYHGGVMPERGLETLIEVVKMNQMIYLYIIGDGAPNYIEKLQELCRARKVDHRVIFHEAVHLDELWKYIGSADVGMIMVRAAWKSYYYMLPNKLFENIQAETPVICSNFPVIRSLVERYGVGLTCDPENLEDINKCIERLRLHPELCRQFKENERAAKEELCWEKEREVLKEAYSKLLA